MFGEGPRPAQYRLRLMSNADEASHGHGAAIRSAPLLLLALSALGVVFGDLGTSPLYALQEAFHGTRGVAPTHDNILGIVSLFLWALILMVSVKYVAVLMRAGNRGEGGILALLALLTGDKSTPTRRGAIFVTLALIGTAMLYGDGIITPAVSVLSAVEGLQMATPALGPSVIPITVCILILLFAVQPFGSGRVGVLFGPILAVWFVVIAILGAVTLASNPAALAAVNPLYAVRFFANNGARGFFALGAVVLCLTGGEALYADMGHFGRTPIRVAWYYLGLPSLVLSYLGQAALLLRNPAAAARPFYACVPAKFLYPMVVLATLATIVASQALISAVFSLTRQAAQLGLSPRVQISPPALVSAHCRWRSSSRVWPATRRTVCVARVCSSPPTTRACRSCSCTTSSTIRCCTRPWYCSRSPPKSRRLSMTRSAFRSRR